MQRILRSRPISNGMNGEFNDKPEIEGDSLERLRKRIYGRQKQYGQERMERPELTPLHDQAPKNWEKIKEEEMAQKKPPPPKKTAYLKFFLIGSIALAIITVTIAAWVILSGGAGQVSLKGAEISIDAPAEVAGGDFVAWQVHVRNKTGRDLETADLIFEYPDGARPVAEEDRKTLRRRISLGTVKKGEEITKTFEAFLFGEEDSVKVAHATLEYRASGANLILANDTEERTRITRSPLTVFMNAPEQINTGDEVEFTVEIASEADDNLENAVLVMQYPEGFSFKEASPFPSIGDTQWILGTIERNESIRITIRGTLSGAELEEKLFRAEVGQESGSDILTVLYGLDSVPIRIEQSFLDFSYSINDGTPSSLKPGSFVDVRVRWKNNLSVPVENAVFRMRFEGDGYDEKTVDVPNGVYRGTDRTITWNASSYAPFAFIEPGKTGTFNFRFRVPLSFPVRSPADANKSIRFIGTFEVQRRPVGYENIDISTTKQYDIKIITDLQIVRKALYYDLVLPGSGPLPPRVGQETIYTIVWSLINSTSDIINLKVRAALPAYMVWKGRIEPYDADIQYDSVSGQIVWTVSLLPQGTGFIRPAREVRFQAGFIPSLKDVGGRPIIISEITAEGIDTFSDVSVHETEAAQNTELRNDPGSQTSDWKVAP